MNPAAAVAITLALLSEALEDPDADIAGEVELLALEAGQAVPSYLAMTITAALHPDPVAITIPPRPWTTAPRTSMRFAIPTALAPSTMPAEPLADLAMTLYASTPGAFVDLSADLAYLFGVPLTRVALDEHLPESGVPQTDTPDDHRPISVADLSVINQAIGVLIGQGHEPDQARHTLTHDAMAAGTTIAVAAALILAATQT